MTDPMSIAATKGQVASAPPAGHQVHQAHQQALQAAKSQADAARVRNIESNGPRNAQDGALSQILSNALRGAARSKPDGQAPGNRQEVGQSERMMAEAFGAVKEYLGSLPSELRFDYDEEANRQVFRVINPVTREVVKQYPPDEFLEMIKRLKELDKNADENGMLFDDRY